MPKAKDLEIKDGMRTDMGYAIMAKADRLLKHRHAWKVWRTLKDFGCRIYLVAPDLPYFCGSKVYPDLAAVQGKVDVVVPCLPREYLADLVQQTAEIKAGYIWFQENNWTPQFEDECRKKGIICVRGCVLKHRVYSKPWAYLNPCYWHGKSENKIPNKYQRI